MMLLHNDGRDFMDGSSGGLQAMGLLSALHTGDARIDLILALCLPFVIQSIFQAVKCLESIVKSRHWFKRVPQMHCRSIMYRTTRNLYGGSSNLDEDDSQNRVLQKAIKLYLHSEVRLQLTVAETHLTATSGKGSLTRHSSYYYDDYHDEQPDESSRTVVGFLSKYKIVQSPPKEVWHTIGHYGNDSSLVELQISHLEEQEGTEKSPLKSQTLSFNFRSRDCRAIDTFIAAAYNWYLDELKKLEDHSRYLYELKSGTASSSITRGGEDDGNAGNQSLSGHVYRRYRLSDEKTFDSLFFHQKTSLLALIDNFQQRKGKYAIKGYPHKLGLLLFGPPGSGKTSLIKALAQCTGRSVINVPLSRIKTNAELTDIFFDNNFRVEGEYVPVKLRFKDVIFVIEDVDAASKIVRRRDCRRTAGRFQTDSIELRSSKPLWHMLLESRDENCKVLVQCLMEKSDRLKDAALNSQVLQLSAERMLAFPGMSVVGGAGNNPILKKAGEEAIMSADLLMTQYDTIGRFLGMHAETLNTLLDNGATVDSSLEDTLLGLASPSKTELPPLPWTFLEPEDCFTKYSEDDDYVHLEESSIRRRDTAKDESHKNGSKVHGPSLPFSLKALDELNLQGLLNVLDGVVDSPGRIVIMTTNHPNQLDPALIRPGRIDKKLLLGYMCATDMIDMLEHYFQASLSEDQRLRVERVVSGNAVSPLSLTPAQVEQMTAEYDELEFMVQALERKSQTLVPRSSIFSTS